MHRNVTFASRNLSSLPFRGYPVAASNLSGERGREPEGKPGGTGEAGRRGQIRRANIVTSTQIPASPPHEPVVSRTWCKLPRSPACPQHARNRSGAAAAAPPPRRGCHSPGSAPVSPHRAPCSGRCSWLPAPGSPHAARHRASHTALPAPGSAPGSPRWAPCIGLPAPSSAPGGRVPASPSPCSGKRSQQPVAFPQSNRFRHHRAPSDFPL